MVGESGRTFALSPADGTFKGGSCEGCSAPVFFLLVSEGVGIAPCVLVSNATSFCSPGPANFFFCLFRERSAFPPGVEFASLTLLLFSPLPPVSKVGILLPPLVHEEFVGSLSSFVCEVGIFINPKQKV